MQLRSWLGTLILFAAAATAAVAATAADPVALLVQVNGAVQVQRAGQPAAVAAAVGMPLHANDQLLLAKDARAVVLYRTGKKETLAQSARIAPPAGRQQSGMFQQTVKTLGQVATTDARSQPNRQGMIRPIAGSAVPILPRNEILLLTTRPTFAWFSVPDADSYTLQIREQGGTPLRFHTGPDTVWTLPSTERQLRPGVVYEWTVAAADEGRPAEVQRFRIAGKKERRMVDKQLKQIRSSGLNPTEDGLFLAALAYRDAGFLYAADQALTQLEGQGGGHGRPFHMLRGEVYNALGWLDAAERHFVLADQTPAE